MAFALNVKVGGTNKKVMNDLEIKERLKRSLRFFFKLQVINLSFYQRDGFLFETYTSNLYVVKDNKYFYYSNLIHSSDYLTILKKLCNKDTFVNPNLMEEVINEMREKVIKFCTNSELDEFNTVKLKIMNGKLWADYLSDFEDIQHLQTSFEVPDIYRSYDYRTDYDKTFPAIYNFINTGIESLNNRLDFAKLFYSMGKIEDSKQLVNDFQPVLINFIKQKEEVELILKNNFNINQC